ncbi:MAG: tRNA (adenosine(37)-N6)-dimethylallyltransferase MiaA [Phycisphaerae bacterium]
MERLIFILGATACGKGSVAREVARRIGGRIVSVDSMKVYRRMDIGTAKPPPQVRREIPHYCIDVAEPSEHFSVARYVECADAAVADIRAAGAVPLAVGGTSLYIKALSEGLFEGPSGDAEIRRRLRSRAEQEGTPALHAELTQVDPTAAARIHPNDRKRIVRALEVYELTGTPISELQRQWGNRRRYDCLLIGLRREKPDLHHRINRRAERMVEAGLVDEVRSLLAEPEGLAPQAAQAVGYAETIEHLQGRLTLEEATERIKINTRRLAKKQRTWHRRWRDVRWVDIDADEPCERTADRVREIILSANEPAGREERT